MFAGRLAYDGRGNAVVASAEAMAAAVEALGGFEHGLYAERWAPFTKARATSLLASSLVARLLSCTLPVPAPLLFCPSHISNIFFRLVLVHMHALLLICTIVSRWRGVLRLCRVGIREDNRQFTASVTHPLDPTQARSAGAGCDGGARLVARVAAYISRRTYYIFAWSLDHPTTMALV